VPEREEYGMILPVKDYYSLVRTPLNQVDHIHAANALLLVEDHGFIFRCRVEVEEDLEGRVISRKPVQIFFVHPDQIILGQRFMTGFVMIIDGTFNTNVPAAATSCGCRYQQFQQHFSSSLLLLSIRKRRSSWFLLWFAERSGISKRCESERACWYAKITKIRPELTLLRS
jgi:hypothetical protein